MKEYQSNIIIELVASSKTRTPISTKTYKLECPFYLGRIQNMALGVKAYKKCLFDKN